MYMFDPEQGERRRAQARDKMVEAWNKTSETLSETSRDLSQRARGIMEQTRGIVEQTKSMVSQEMAEHMPSGESGSPTAGGWSTTRVLMSAAGGALALYGVKRRGALGATLGSLGVGMLARGLTNVDMSRLLGIGGGEAIDFHKTININAPVHRVYEFWTNYENFPRFMSNVQEVRPMGSDRSHWKVSGPAGVPVEWDAEVTRQEPNRELAWQSVPGSPIENGGRIRFEPSNGGTRVDIRMYYNPPAGEAGHSAAQLFGADPKSMMDEDLMRMKQLIESGTATPGGSQGRSPEREGHGH
jgi:uncharacterized membrane protein